MFFAIQNQLNKDAKDIKSQCNPTDDQKKTGNNNTLFNKTSAQEKGNWCTTMEKTQEFYEKNEITILSKILGLK